MDCMSSDEKWEICERFGLRPSELCDYLRDINGDDPRDIVDCSLYPNIITVDDIDYYFRSMTSGQYDSRSDMDDEDAEFVDKGIYNELHKIWDKYHLKKVGGDVIFIVNWMKEKLGKVDEEKWIRDYIERNFY